MGDVLWAAMAEKNIVLFLQYRTKEQLHII